MNSLKKKFAAAGGLLGLLYLAFCVTFFVFYLHDLLEMA